MLLGELGTEARHYLSVRARNALEYSGVEIGSRKELLAAMKDGRINPKTLRNLGPVTMEEIRKWAETKPEPEFQYDVMRAMSWRMYRLICNEGIKTREDLIAAIRSGKFNHETVKNLPKRSMADVCQWLGIEMPA